MWAPRSSPAQDYSAERPLRRLGGKQDDDIAALQALLAIHRVERDVDARGRGVADLVEVGEDLRALQVFLRAHRADQVAARLRWHVKRDLIVGHDPRAGDPLSGALHELRSPLKDGPEVMDKRRAIVGPSQTGGGQGAPGLQDHSRGMPTADR